MVRSAINLVRQVRCFAALLLLVSGVASGGAPDAHASPPPQPHFSGVAVWERGETATVVRIDSGVTPFGPYRLVTVEAVNGRATLCWQGRCRTDLPLDGVVLEEDWGSYPPSVPSWTQPLERIAAHYRVEPLPEKRWQGIPAEGWFLVPRDPWRFPQRWWIAAGTGVTLEREIFDEAMTRLERFAFVRFTPRAQADFAEVRSRWSALGRKKRVDFRLHPVAAEAMPWQLTDLPPGFTLVTSGWRDGPSGAKVWQWLLSDGVASVSLFAEALSDSLPGGSDSPSSAEDGGREGEQRWGATGAVRAQRGQWLQTAVGEVPWVTLRRLLHGLVPTGGVQEGMTR